MHMSRQIAAAILAFCASRVGSVPVAELAVRQAESSLLDATATDLVTGPATSGVVDGPSGVATATGGLSDIASETDFAIPTGGDVIPTATSGNLPGNTGAPGPSGRPNGGDDPSDDFDDLNDDGDDGPEDGECKGRRRGRSGRPSGNGSSAGQPGVGRPTGTRPNGPNRPTGAATGAPEITSEAGSPIATGSGTDPVFIPSGSFDASAPIATGLEDAASTGLDDLASILPATDSAAAQPTGTSNLSKRQAPPGGGPMGPPDGQFDGQIPPEIASRIPASVLQQISAGNFPTAIPESVRSRFRNGERPSGRPRPGGPGSPSGLDANSAGIPDATGSGNAQLPEETEVATATA